MDIFEKLLLSNEILSAEELEHYKKIQASSLQKEHLGKILLDKGLIDADLLARLQKAEEESKQQYKLLKKQKKDKKILEVVQQLGIVRPKEIAECIRERREAENQGKQIFVCDLFIQKNYLTPYLIGKFYKRGIKRVPLPEGVKSHEDLIVNIPNYLRDRLLGKIAIKNKLLSRDQLEICWNALKKGWPRKALAEVILEKGIMGEKKVKNLSRILIKALLDAYPYYNGQLRDMQLARLLAKRNFLSPWRLNKCLLRQLDQLKRKTYIALRQMLVDDAYLTNYQFDTVLKQYGDLVKVSIPEISVPMEEIKIIPKDELEKAIQEADSDVHLIVEEEDIENFNLEKDLEKSALDAEDYEEGDEEPDENNLPTLSLEKKESLHDDFSTIVSQGKSAETRHVEPLSAKLTSAESASVVPNSIEENSAIMHHDDADDVINWEVEAEDANDLENWPDIIVDNDPSEGENEEISIGTDEIDEVLNEAQIDASEQYYAEELVIDDLEDLEKKKKKEKKK